MFHHGVERAALWALDAKKVPLQIVCFRFTVITHNIDRSLQIRRHGVFGNVPRSRFPGSGHTLLADNRLFANGASIVKAGKFSEAVRVDSMAAREVLRRLSRRKHVFAADGAVVLVLVLKALVCFKDRRRYAHAALAAVTERLHPTHSTKSTLVAMKRFFSHGHPKIADGAMVFTEDDLAVDALVSIMTRVCV